MAGSEDTNLTAPSQIAKFSPFKHHLHFRVLGPKHRHMLVLVRSRLGPSLKLPQLQEIYWIVVLWVQSKLGATVGVLG